MTQINPPYDSSAPCPACQDEVRGVSAYLHNFLTRCDVKAGKIREGKAFLRLVDMRRFGLPRELTVDHPAAREVVEVCRELCQAIAGIEDEGMTIRWTPEIVAKVEALIPRAAAASDAFNVLSDAHFRDHRHSHGDVNILRQQSGSKWAGFVSPDYKAAAYNHTVEVVSEGGDLVHEPCGTRLALGEHFKDQLALDPTFYGKVWCPTCKLNAAWPQFKLDPDVLLIGG